MAAIVVVDDDRDMVELVTSVLSRAGHEVRATVNAGEAMDLVRQAVTGAQQPVIVVTDIFMPGHDGLELIEEIKRSYPALGVLAISGGSPTGSGYLSAARAYGADLTLPKPFRPLELRAAIDELIAIAD